MLIISLFILITVVALQPSFSPSLLIRTVSLVLIICFIIIINTITSDYNNIIIYCGIAEVSNISQYADIIITISGAIAIIPWINSQIVTKITSVQSVIPIYSEQGLIVLFTVIGSSILVSSNDLVIIYLSVELQSFAVYIIATLYRNSESATAAGLKYYLLGGLSSSLLLLGAALIYNATGTTNLQNISIIINEIDYTITVGIILLISGLLFKVASAPFHNWAPDVYDGVPTIVTIWLSNLTKLSILIIIINLYTNWSISFNIVLSICSFLSLIIGSIVGISQTRIKRLLAYSTINHVGFILLVISIGNYESYNVFLFYLIQYTITSLTTFLIILAIGYSITSQYGYGDINRISSYSGIIQQQPILTISIIICLFSITGVPPIIGFVAKANVLLIAITSGYTFIAFIAVIISIISGAYYLYIIRVIAFSASSNNVILSVNGITSVHTFLISFLTLAVILFLIQPELILDSISVLAY